MSRDYFTNLFANVQFDKCNSHLITLGYITLTDAICKWLYIALMSSDESIVQKKLNPVR
jgi:hypothetical protein